MGDGMGDGLCRCCGQPMAGSPGGVPVYEGKVLPKGWDGPWAGFDACLTCFSAQTWIERPIPIGEFVRFAYRGSPPDGMGTKGAGGGV